MTRWPANPVPRYFDPSEHGLGLLVPVVGGHAGVGATGIALALADAAAAAGLRTLLVDGADPARSGLPGVWTSMQRSDVPCRDGATITTVRRGAVVGRRIAALGRPLPRRIYPLLVEWASPQFRRDQTPFDVTIVDVGWNAWTGFDEVRFGPLAWVGGLANLTSPVLVTRATAPSLRLTTGVHARWSAALAAGEVEAAPRLAAAVCRELTAATRVHSPPSLAYALGDAVCFPPVAAAAELGWTETRSPAASIAAGTALLRSLLPSLTERLPAARSTPRFRRTQKEN